MNFPLSYTGQVVFYKPEGFNTNEFVDAFIQRFNIQTAGADNMHFTASISLSGLPIKLWVSMVDDNVTIACNYRISLFENNLIMVASWIFAVFFYLNHLKFFSVAFLGVGLLYYLVNTAKISNSLKKEFFRLMGSKIEYGNAELWKMQKQWMKDKTICPACGEPKNKYSNACVNCGLVFSKNKIQMSQTNMSNLNTSTINFEVTKKNIEKNNS